ncbi:HAMP domain-containing histidine kinase [Aquincola tertiaricarbonis]|uniref:histidine kinase n=1 Tax=Aquincola tertiaricarbonis TaxID=391953 RepID=A0ABY4S1F7_AQUTE|nr:HAMP domain-containing sensor histidine kinase [Aquincola tertiaricarbonis]URI07268.1 HAMP domain-containing histidine kinase [Aquincola tertiaricarbonis]
MHLVELIDDAAVPLLHSCDALPPAQAASLLQAVADDLRRTAASTACSLSPPARMNGHAPAARPCGEAPAACTLAQLMAGCGAVRAELLRHWLHTAPPAARMAQDLARLNGAVDVALGAAAEGLMRETERARNVFLSVLGHDLRTPISVLSIGCRLMGATPLNTAARSTLERQTRSLHRMTQLLDDLLDYNRASLDIGLQTASAPVDLAQVCRDELDQQQAMLSADRSLSFQCEARRLSLQADASRLRQVVGNLVDNARKYGAAGTPITVNLKRRESTAELSVTSLGPTLPKAMSEALFEPLRRGHSATFDGERSHLGIGLFIVRQVAQAHGGTATVSSAAGRTTFTVRLPLAQP